MSLESLLERLMPDEAFEEVMRTMVDSSWLRERAETVANSGEPESNVKAAALLEAADAIDTRTTDSGVEEATPAPAEASP